MLLSYYHTFGFESHNTNYLYVHIIQIKLNTCINKKQNLFKEDCNLCFTHSISL